MCTGTPHLRVTQCGRRILVWLPEQPWPPALLTELPSIGQELLVRVASPASIPRHNHRNLRVLHEMRVFVVDDDEAGAAVLEDVRDLRLRQARVDRADDCAGGEDAVVRICSLWRSGASARGSSEGGAYQL